MAQNNTINGQQQAAGSAPWPLPCRAVSTRPIITEGSYDEG